MDAAVNLEDDSEVDRDFRDKDRLDSLVGRIMEFGALDIILRQHPTDYTIRDITLAAIRHDNPLKRYMIKNKKRKDYPILEMPGGKVRESENIHKAALVRELREEINLYNGNLTFDGLDTQKVDQKITYDIKPIVSLAYIRTLNGERDIPRVNTINIYDVKVHNPELLKVKPTTIYDEEFDVQPVDLEFIELDENNPRSIYQESYALHENINTGEIERLRLAPAVAEYARMVRQDHIKVPAFLPYSVVRNWRHYNNKN